MNVPQQLLPCYLVADVLERERALDSLNGPRPTFATSLPSNNGRRLHVIRAIIRQACIGSEGVAR